ncbi:unnamed protein product [Lepidochelys kempii]
MFSVKAPQIWNLPSVWCSLSTNTHICMFNVAGTSDAEQDPGHGQCSEYSKEDENPQEGTREEEQSCCELFPSMPPSSDANCVWSGEYMFSSHILFLPFPALNKPSEIAGMPCPSLLYTSHIRTSCQQARSSTQVLASLHQGEVPRESTLMSGPWDAVLRMRTAGKRWDPSDQEEEEHLCVPTC